MSHRRTRRIPLSNTAILLLILLAFVILGVVVWFRWSADAVSAADNAAGKVVQEQPLKGPQPAGPAMPDNRPGADASGDAVADKTGQRPVEGAGPS